MLKEELINSIRSSEEGSNSNYKIKVIKKGFLIRALFLYNKLLTFMSGICILY